MLAPLTNAPLGFAWGSTTLIAGLEGREPTGRPEAEVWFGDHPGSPAMIDDGSGRTLAAWRAEDAEDSPERLPYLLKLLAAASPLSIQVHPDRAQARAGFAAEEAEGVALDAPHRSYKDDNHKPEIIVAISDRFDAYAGLRPVAGTRRLLEAVGDGRGSAALRAVLTGDDALASAVAWALTEATADIVAHIESEVRAADSVEFAAELSALRRLSDAYPGDPGILVALLMNHVSLARGEALYVPAGMLHAYLSGLGVELMAASDNVLRAGLTGKHIDVAELLRIVDARPTPPPLLAPTVTADGVEVFAPDIPDFQLARVILSPGETVALEVHGPVICLGVAGDVTVTGAHESEGLQPGRAVFGTAAESRLELAGAGEVFVASPGGSWASRR